MKRDRKEENIKRLIRYIENRNLDHTNETPSPTDYKIIKSSLQDGIRTLQGITVDNMYRMVRDTSPFISDDYFKSTCLQLTNVARSLGKMGIKQTKEHREAISLGLKGKSKTEEHKDNISKKLAGNKNRTFTENQKKDHSKIMKKHYEEMKPKVDRPKTIMDFLDV